MDDFLEILGLPIRALRDRIQQELDENPVLELEAFDASVGAVAAPLAILQLPIQALRDRIEEELSDIVVDCSKAGEPEVWVPDEELTHLVINRRYSEMHQNSSADPPAREFLGRMIKKAQRLLEALERRRAILKQVGVAILRQQRTFLEHGPGHIVPLSAEQVAREIGAPTPTVLEAVKNKQVRTPHGVVSLDSFLVRHPRPSDH